MCSNWGGTTPQLVYKNKAQLGTLTASTSYSSKTITSIESYDYIEITFSNNSGTMMDYYFSSKDKFKEYNSQTNNIDFSSTGTANAQLYYVNDTSIMLKSARTTDIISIFGIKET